MSDLAADTGPEANSPSFEDVCSQAAPAMGAIAGTVYTEIAGPAVGFGVGNYVEQHWPDTCALPDAAAQAIHDAAQSYHDATVYDGHDYGTSFGNDLTP